MQEAETRRSRMHGRDEAGAGRDAVREKDAATEAAEAAAEGAGEWTCSPTRDA